MSDVILREVPEQVVLTEQRTLGAADLQPWLREAMGRLGAAADRAGDWFVVYHGQFTDDTPEVPVEVCLPVRAGTGESATRVEPAHREAYLTLKKAQFTNPAEVARAFGTVAEWIARNSLSIADAPREVYFTDFSAAADDDEVCHIAFPVR